MFSLEQKKMMAAEVEKMLLDIGHPEMPKENPDFTLSVKGVEVMSWAEIHPDWTFDEKTKPGINPHNEAQESKSSGGV